MSFENEVLHSHSGLERELRLPKYVVLIDVSFGYLFMDEPKKTFKHDGKTYYKVMTQSFVRKGGVFRNLSK